MTALPRGIGLVRIESPLGVVVFASDRLTAREEEAARIMATTIALTDHHCIVVLRESEIERTLREAS